VEGLRVIGAAMAEAGVVGIGRLTLSRRVTGSEPAKKSGQNIPKNRCRTTIAERIVETLAELPFIGNQIVCLSHDQAARSGPARKRATEAGSQ
jgi:hypothetical protein